MGQAKSFIGYDERLRHEWCIAHTRRIAYLRSAFFRRLLSDPPMRLSGCRIMNAATTDTTASTAPTGPDHTKPIPLLATAPPKNDPVAMPRSDEVGITADANVNARG